MKLVSPLLQSPHPAGDLLRGRPGLNGGPQAGHPGPLDLLGGQQQQRGKNVGNVTDGGFTSGRILVFSSFGEIPACASWFSGLRAKQLLI